METETGAPILGEHKVSYHVKHEHFEGPLDLLLSLIEKRKLFINDFALAKVADDYIAHIRQFEAFPLNDVANFLLVASTLVLIKSKSILPELDLSREEEGDVDELKRRLALYELFRNLATEVRANFGKKLIFERSARPEMIPVFAPDKRLSPATMLSSVSEVIAMLPKKVVVPKATVKKVISLEEMMDKLAQRVAKTLKTSFGQFSRYQKGARVPREHRVEIIVSFLAILELVKQGVIHVTQHEDHGEIDIETHTFSTPSYT